MTWTALEDEGRPAAQPPLLREARCARLVDAYYLNLSLRLRSDLAVPFDPTLREELLFAEFREDQEDGSKLVSKREYRKQLGRSPDLTDATAFAFWEGRVAPASEAAAEHRAQVAAAQPAPRTEPRTPAEAVEQLQRGPHGLSVYNAHLFGRR